MPLILPPPGHTVCSGRGPDGPTYVAAPLLGPDDAPVLVSGPGDDCYRPCGLTVAWVRRFGRLSAVLDWLKVPIYQGGDPYPPDWRGSR